VINSTERCQPCATLCHPAAGWLATKSLRGATEGRELLGGWVVSYDYTGCCLALRAEQLTHPTPPRPVAATRKVILYTILYFFSLTMFTYFGQLLTFATPNQVGWWEGRSVEPGMREPAGSTAATMCALSPAV